MRLRRLDADDDALPIELLRFDVADWVNKDEPVDVRPTWHTDLPDWEWTVLNALRRRSAASRRWQEARGLNNAEFQALLTQARAAGGRSPNRNTELHHETIHQSTNDTRSQEMTTTSKQPVPPKAVVPSSMIVSDSNSPTSNAYARPTAGGNASGPAYGPLGSAPDRPLAGDVPANPIKGGLADLDSPLGAPVETGNTQTGPNIGHGATIVFPHNDDTGAKDDGNYKGTVGPSGPGLDQA